MKRSRAHRADCDVVVAGSFGLPLARPLDAQWALLRGLRALAVLKVFRSLVSVRAVRQMVLIFVASVPAFTNVALLLFLVMFVYAVLGVSLFSQILPDDTDRSGRDDASMQPVIDEHLAASKAALLNFRRPLKSDEKVDSDIKWRATCAP